VLGFAVFESFKEPRRSIAIDLASVRDTLLYIESDLNRAPELQRLAIAVRGALTEIDRLERGDTDIAKPDFSAARFLPMRP
jgi:hypothetical protein